MWLYATMYIYTYAIICMYTTRLKMRMPQSLRFFRPRWMQLSSARLCHTLHNCNTKRPSWFFGCFGCLCKRPWENDVSHSLCCTREQRMQRIPDYKTQREKTAFCEVKVLLKQDHASILPIPNSLLKLQRTCPCTWQQQRPPPLPWLRKLGLLSDRNTSFILLHAISIFSILFYIFLLSRFLFSWIFTFHNEGNSTKTSGLQCTLLILVMMSVKGLPCSVVALKIKTSYNTRIEPWKSYEPEVSKCFRSLLYPLVTSPCAWHERHFLALTLKASKSPSYCWGTCMKLETRINYWHIAFLCNLWH